jgi:hypothetical protein
VPQQHQYQQQQLPQQQFYRRNYPRGNNRFQPPQQGNNGPRLPFHKQVEGYSVGRTLSEAGVEESRYRSPAFPERRDLCIYHQVFGAAARTCFHGGCSMANTPVEMPRDNAQPRRSFSGQYRGNYGGFRGTYYNSGYDRRASGGRGSNNQQFNNAPPPGGRPSYADVAQRGANSSGKEMSGNGCGSGGL